MARASVRPDVAQSALARAGWRCEKCGTTASVASGIRLEIHHALGRKPSRLVNEPENLVVLCKRWGSEPGCHDWWHANKRRALAWFAAKFGSDRLASLRSIQNCKAFAAGGVPPAGSTGESTGCVCWRQTGGGPRR